MSVTFGIFFAIGGEGRELSLSAAGRLRIATGAKHPTNKRASKIACKLRCFIATPPCSVSDATDSISVFWSAAGWRPLLRVVIPRRPNRAKQLPLLRHSCQLRHRPLRLQDRKPVIHRTRQIRICERDPPKRRLSQHLARRRLAVLPEEKSRLWTQVRMPPAVQYDSRNILPRVEPCAPEHLRELLPNPLLIFPKRRRQHLPAPAVSLLLGGVTRIRIQHLHRQHHR